MGNYTMTVAATVVALALSACGTTAPEAPAPAATPEPRAGSQESWAAEFDGELAFMCGYSRTTILRHAAGMDDRLNPRGFVLAWEACQTEGEGEQ